MLSKYTHKCFLKSHSNGDNTLSSWQPWATNTSIVSPCRDMFLVHQQMMSSTPCLVRNDVNASKEVLSNAQEQFFGLEFLPPVDVQSHKIFLVDKPVCFREVTFVL